MKTKFLFSTIIATIFYVTSLYGQQRTDYQEYGVVGYPSGTQGYTTSLASSYYFGQTWFFQWVKNDNLYEHGWDLNYTSLTAQTDGTFDNSMLGTLGSFGNEYFSSPQVNSCVFNNTLFVFHYFYDEDTGGGPSIMCYTKTPHTELHYSASEISINEEISRQMGAAAVGDTLYIFFVDDADNKVKYYMAKYKPAEYNTPITFELTSTTPTVLSHTLIPHGNISACNFTDENNNEKIMISYVSNSSGNNEVIMFSGTNSNFELFKQFDTHPDYSAENIYVEQGSVVGGEKNSYMFQVGYCNSNVAETQGPIRCEIKYSNQQASDWEITNIDPDLPLGNNLSGFMTYYTKHSTKREKHLYQMFITEYLPLDVWGLHWYSDKLEYADKREDIAPFNYDGSFFDIALVAEGPPPYTLNGQVLNDPMFDNNPPSTFDYTVSTENDVSTTTTYSLGVEANMGYGPVTAGFKASFQESSGTSVTEMVSITEHLIPPKINSDSAGLMWYYYVTPTIERIRWTMKDYDGDLIQPKRNLFFFKLNSPQMYDTTFSFVNYDTNSPRAYDLKTYQNRDISNISGVEEILHKGGDVNYAGSTPEINITFSESHSTTHSDSFEATVGIDEDFGIFSASASITASLEYESESVTTCEHGFDITWNLLSAKDPESDSNIRKFTPTAYFMRTTHDNAYFLDNDSVPEEFKNFKPFFVTYDVGEITYGNLTDPPFLIGENTTIAEKYSFRNYPNPFSNQSNFEYTLPHRSNISLSIYNAYGQLVSKPVCEIQGAGKQQVYLTIPKLPSGIYHYRLLIDEDLIIGKIVKK